MVNNGEKIIFLESNTKRLTIKSFLNDKYKIFATGGHLLSLKKTGDYNLGVNLESDFTPQYEVMSNKSRLIDFWRNYLIENSSSMIFIATDPDREGEGIAREIVSILNLDESRYKRLFFHEITYSAINDSLKNPSKIDQNLVEAQMSREVLDRMIGFCLSTLLQKKMNAWSAGRVQSVVLKLIVDREREIFNYGNKKEFILVAFSKFGRRKVKFTQREEENFNSLKLFKNFKDAEDSSRFLSKNFLLLKKEENYRYIFPKNPLTTSLLLYECKVVFGYSIQRTTSIAQKLYEGLFIKSKKKRISLITYPRTDSSRVSKIFVSQISKLIKEKWGEGNFRFIKNDLNKKNVQDAHESIRPTYLQYDPAMLEKEDLDKEIFNVYKLIYNHTVSSFMQPIKYLEKLYYFSSNGITLGSSEKIIIEKGFLLLDESKSSKYGLLKNSLLDNENILEINEIKIEENTDNIPKRYTEGTLIKKLEILGIGRPSTYNSFSKIIIKRKYSYFDKTGSFIPTDLGFKVNDWLQIKFNSLINENYTASLEDNLDRISNGEMSYVVFISEFWKKFIELYKFAEMND